MDFIQRCFKEKNHAPTIGTPQQIERVESPLELAAKLADEIRVEFREMPENVQKVLAITKYLSQTNISGYSLIRQQKLTIFCLLKGDKYRVHEGKIFRYQQGLWQIQEALDLQDNDVLTACEGLHIRLAENDSLEWHWSAITAEIMHQIQQEHLISLDSLCYEAKQSGDYLKRITNNQTYNGNWASRMQDMIQDLKKSFDRQNTVLELTNEFIRQCETEKPKSNGIQFKDIYLDSNYEPATSSPENNCYFGVHYDFNIGDVEPKYNEFLTSFLKSYYYKNENLMLIKLAQMRCAIEQIPTGKILWEIGPGGSGKSQMYTLESNVLGKENTAVLDCAIFYDRNEFRKSSHFGINKTYIRFQEIKKSTGINADIWKKTISGETLDARENYGKTMKINFKNSMKVQEANMQSLPVIEACFDNEQFCKSIKRRIIAGVIGRATLVHNEEDVSHEEGRFMSIPQDQIEEMVNHPIVSALFMRNFYIPFIRTYDLDFAKRLLMNPSTIDDNIERDSCWLAMKLSGKNPLAQDFPGLPCDLHAAIQPLQSDNDRNVSYTQHLININVEMGCKTKVLKQYRIGRSQYLKNIHLSNEVSQLRLKTNYQKFDHLLDLSDYKLYKKLPSGDYDCLQVDAQKFVQQFRDNGGQEVFGTPEQWGDTFDSKKNLQANNQASQSYIEPEQKRIPTSTYTEKINIRSLKQYASNNTDKKQQQLDVFIHKFEQDADAEYVEHKVNYHKKIIDPHRNVIYHRQHASQQSLQQLSSEARKAATKSHAVDVDINNAHPALLLKILQKIESNEPQTQEYPMLLLYCKHFQRWRKFVANYFQITIAEAKVKLITYFYGGTNHGDIPFLVRLLNEIHHIVQILITLDQFKQIIYSFQKRNNPNFSALSYMIFELEDEFMQQILSELQVQANSTALALIYDGAIVSCNGQEQKHKIILCLADCSEKLGIRLKISDWGFEETLISWRLLEKGFAIIDREKTLRANQSNSICWTLEQINESIDETLRESHIATIEQYNISSSACEKEEYWQEHDYSAALLSTNNWIIMREIDEYSAVQIAPPDIWVHSHYLPHVIKTDIFNFGLILEEFHSKVRIYIREIKKQTIDMRQLNESF